ncbi:MAG TPA: ATP-binding protein [Acidimicrobiales bacterium]|nr:ATP-binding protein [Acidimicrobiales bacterium]
MSRSRPASPGSDQLRLGPDPIAARDARAWVTGVLARWPAESVETARLLVSELVTNSVLHTGTAIAVACRPDRTGVRFEVSDGDRSGPVPKRHAPDSPTGRGMRLLVSLSEEWGIERDSEGKTVWFVVRPSTRMVPRGDPELCSTGAWAEPREVTGLTAPRPSDSDPEDDAVESPDVQALAVPLEVYLEAEQHDDAVIRELTLIVQSASSPSGLEVPPRLLELAREVTSAFADLGDGVRAQAEEAARRGERTVDLHLSVRHQGWERLLRVVDLLDEVDRWCERGELLTLASPPRLRRFRAWYREQVVDQMHGLAPRPWEDTPKG